MFNQPKRDKGFSDYRDCDPFCTELRFLKGRLQYRVKSVGAGSAHGTGYTYSGDWSEWKGVPEAVE